MTPEEALNLLDQAASMANLNRVSHFQIQEATRVLRESIQDGSKDEDGSEG